MIYTSYFAQLNKLPNNIIPISICAKAPDWYKGLQYKKLAPKYDFFMEWKKNHDNDYYIEHFQNEVLNTLNPLKVLTELQIKIPDDIKIQMQSPFYSNHEWHVALICYEKPSDFCHRHLVAKWLTENGCPCEEYKF